MADVRSKRVPQHDKGGRWTKISLDKLSPFDPTLYLDADTRVRESVAPLFEWVEAGWDMAMALSSNQHGKDWLWHVSDAERQITARVVGPCIPQYQGGMMCFRKTEAVHRLFEAWRGEWAQFEDQDQGAFMRALMFCPVKMWAVGSPWNGGTAIAHLFGRARQ